MKLQNIVFAIIWCAVGAGLIFVFIEHGKLIGGAQYFVHMGIGGSAAAELTLIAGSFLLTVALLLNLTGVIKFASAAIGLVALAFAGSFFLPFKLFFLLNPMVFPPAGGPAVFLAMTLAVVTWATFVVEKQSDNEP